MEIDQNILPDAIAGDRAALQRLLQQVGPAVHREISRKIEQRYAGQIDADDVMQVTYLEAFLRIGSFVPNSAGSFAAWLRRIAENNLVDAIRRVKPCKRIYHPTGGDCDPETTLYRTLTSGNATASKNVAQAEARQALRAAMKTLPPDYSQVIQLFDLDGKSGAEVARLMGRRHGAVRMLLARARELLRERLGTFSRYC